MASEQTNSKDESLKLVHKVWLSGSDEAVFEASRLDNSNFSLANKSARNMLGTVYKDFLNNKILESDVLNNILPNTNLQNDLASEENIFKLRSIASYFGDGSIKTLEFAEGHTLTNYKGANFTESISPEGRKSRSIYNAIGELITIQKGLDTSGNVTDKSHIMNLSYDSFNRFVTLNDNDGLNATQHFGANGKIVSLTNNRLGVGTYFFDDAGRLTNSNLCTIGTSNDACINSTNKTILEKNVVYNEVGKIKETNSFKFDRVTGLNSHDKTLFTYGSVKTNSSPVEFGMLVESQVIANSNLGTSKSVRTYTHNEEAQLVSEDLELFLGAIHNQDSIAHYLMDRS